jgi:DNA ligase-1
MTVMFKPLLAPGQDPLSYSNYFDELQYPYLVSPKLDGIRAIVKGGTVFSRTGKPLPSFQVQDDFGVYEHFDGELIVGKSTAHNVYNLTQSHVMAYEKPADITFHVFDYTHPDVLHLPFYERLNIVEEKIEMLNNPLLIPVIHRGADTLQELLEWEELFLTAGYEGVMLRSPIAPYKNGRATWKQNIIYKLKRFTDAEARIVGLKEQFTNTNVQEKDELGYSKRSYKLEGLVHANTLGAFYVEFGGSVIEVAPGNFNHKERKEIWDERWKYIDKIIKFRYFAYGVKEMPRFPRAVGFRDKIDM